MTMPEPPAYGGVPQWPFSPPDAVAWGWNKFRQFFGPVLVGVGIYVGVTVAVGMISGIVSLALDLGGQVTDNDLGFQIADSTSQLVFQIVSWITGTILGGAAARAALDVADGRQYDYLNALQRIPIVKLLWASLLVGFVCVAYAVTVGALGALGYFVLHLPIWGLVGLGAVLLLVPLVIAGLFVVFTSWVLVDEPTTPVVAAIRASARMVRANLGNTILLLLLSALVMIAGFLACCIGLLVAYPVVCFATANAYRRFQGSTVAG